MLSWQSSLNAPSPRVILLPHQDHRGGPCAILWFDHPFFIRFFICRSTSLSFSSPSKCGGCFIGLTWGVVGTLCGIKLDGTFSVIPFVCSHYIPEVLDEELHFRGPSVLRYFEWCLCSSLGMAKQCSQHVCGQVTYGRLRDCQFIVFCAQGLCHSLSCRSDPGSGWVSYYCFLPIGSYSWPCGCWGDRGCQRPTSWLCVYAVCGYSKFILNFLLKYYKRCTGEDSTRKKY